VHEIGAALDPAPLILRLSRRLVTLDCEAPAPEPISDFADGVLEPVSGNSYCEFKGMASYFDLVIAGERISRGAWTYENPSKGFASLAGKVALYASNVDQCRVGDEVVIPQEGDFYGGWITSNIEGPFKGAPGTLGW
jgi:hypothetical protein